MREIKFRAWDKFYKHFHEGDIIRDYILGEFVDDSDYEVSQYTGLIDIKSVDIYEKDLLMDDEGFIWKVIYKQGAFYAECADLMAEQLLSSVNLYSRVIGNIYQNPKLVQS